MTAISRFLPLFVAFGVGYALRALAKPVGAERRSARRGEKGEPRYVRPAGPASMRNPPSDWSLVDEQIDESFPASDPPSNY